MNSYQKLKAENKRLKECIESLVFNPDGAESMNIKFSYKLLRDVEIQLLGGSASNQNQTNGILSQITNSKPQ